MIAMLVSTMLTVAIGDAFETKKKIACFVIACGCQQKENNISIALVLSF